MLCDYDMGSSNGVDLTVAFREWERVHRPGQTQPIFALTAYTDTNTATACEAAGMQALPCLVLLVL